MGVSVVGWGLPGPRRILWDTGWGSGPPTPSAFCEDSEWEEGPALCPLPEPQVRLLSGNSALLQPRAHSWVGQGVGSLRLPGRPQPRSLARGLGGLCSWSSRVSGSCARSPLAGALLREPGPRWASRGPRLLVWACSGAGGVTAEVGARVDPPDRKQNRWGPRALGALPGCEPPRPAGSSPLSLKSAVS